MEKEQALLESERRYRQLFDTMVQGVVYQDADGRITAANPAAERILGLAANHAYGWTSTDPRWRAVRDDGSDLPGQEHPAMVALRTGLPARNVTMGVCHAESGDRRWILVDAVPEFTNGDTRPSGVFTTFSDVTQRRRSDRILEARLRLMQFASTHSLRDVLRATLDEVEELTGSHIGFYQSYDEDARMMRLEAWSTRTAAEFCRFANAGRPYPLPEAGAWADCVRERRPAIYNDVTSAADARGAGARGERELVVPVFRGDRIVAALGVGNKAREYTEQDVDSTLWLADLAWDIAERKRAERVVQESEARYRMISENTQDVIWLVDLDTGLYKYVSPSVLRLRGYTSAELVGRPFTFGAAPDAEAMMRDELTHRAAVFNGGDVSARVMTHETVESRKDGTSVETEVITTLLADRDGRAAELLGVSRDITARKRLEAQFLQAQKLEAIGQLAGGVAHDFNNILAAMLMQLNLLQEKAELAPDVMAGLAELERSAQRGAGLTRQLLLFGRRQAMQVKRLDLNDLVQGLLKMIRRLVGENIDIPFTMGAGNLWLDGDAGMLEQMVMNLCVNARDAMPGGGCLTLATRRETVTRAHVSRHPEARIGKFVCLSVTDTGTGMDASMVKRIFEPFFTTKETGKGTGLGLSTVYGIVKQHRGWTTVNSTLGVGTTFQVYLPYVNGAHGDGAHAEAAHADAQGVRRGTESILLVEDDTGVRHLGASGLRSAGYRVIEAASGVDAVRVWEEVGGHVDVLLTDMIMPEGMNGLDLATRLRELKPDLNVVVSSGYSVDLTHRPAGGGEIVFLPKPWSLSDLTAAVRRAIDGDRPAPKHRKGAASG